MPPPSSRRAVVGVAGALSVALFITLAVVVSREPSAQAQTRVDRGIVWRRVDGVTLRLDAYLPGGSANVARPAVLLVHGGGWAGGHRAEMGRTGRQLAKAGYAAFSIDYRLAPEHPFPASLVDAQAAVAWLRAPEQVARYRIDPARIGALGASAGGQLVGLLATKGTGPLDTGTRIRAAVSWSGPMLFWPLTKLQGPPLSDDTIAWWIDAVTTYLGCGNNLGARCASLASDASPLNFVDAGDTPMLLANGTREIVPTSEATTMADALARADVPHQSVIVDGKRHATMLRSDVWGETLQFLDEHLGRRFA